MQATQSQPVKPSDVLAFQSNEAPGKEKLSIGSTTSEVDRLGAYSWLTCRITVAIPFRSITVRQLIDLQVGSVLETAQEHTAEVPLKCNGQTIGNAEFEVVGDNLAVRITELT